MKSPKFSELLTSLLYRKGVVCLLLFVLLSSVSVQAQALKKEDLPSPRGAFLRSLVVPGWGHYYANNQNWTRGKVHLAGEVVLVLSYFGLNARANYLENDFRTLAHSKAGAQLSGKPREYLIALGNYNSLAEYNDAQLRTRNWDKVFPQTAEYRWDWESSGLRGQYQDTRERVDKNRSQLPTLVALMVTNRLVSGLSAFIRARDRRQNVPEASFSYVNPYGGQGIMAHLKFSF